MFWFVPFLFIIQLCYTIISYILMKATELHAHLFRIGLHANPSSSISQVLISYCSNNLLNKALLVFHQLERPTTFVCNSIIRAFSESDRPVESIPIYHQMRLHGLTLNDSTFLFFVKACTRLQDCLHGRMAHLHSLKLGFESYLFVSNSFIHMYSSCGDFVSARKLFDQMPDRDVVSWNSLICGYSHNSQFREVLILFQAMQAENLKADAVTMVKVVLACSHLGDGDFADSVVEYIERNNVDLDVTLANTLIDLYGRRGCAESARNVFDKMRERNIVSWNTMIKSYAKARDLVAADLVAARELFDNMPVKDVIAWTSMITGYSQSSQHDEALKLFREMMVANVRPDEITVTTVLSSCAHLGSLDTGKFVHKYIHEHNIKADIHVGNSLIDMYFKCGCITKALEVFEEMVEKDTISWSAVIQGLAVNGYANKALKFFYNMLREGVRPSESTFVGVLVACAHVGLVDEGLQHFESMKKVHGVEPKMKHYGCVIDLLSRSGQLDEAYEFIKSIPMNVDAIVWRILLNGCKVYENVDLAEIALKKLMELDPSNSGNYVLLSNTYAGADRWGDAVTVRKLMKESDVAKAPGCSSIEVEDSVASLVTQDMLLPVSE